MTRPTTMATYVRRDEPAGAELPFLVWRFARPMRVVSSAPVGGGLGTRSWILNAQVRAGYDRVDLHDHVATLARLAGVPDDLEGIGLLTAANVTAGFEASDGGVDVRSSVGINVAVWAAAPPEAATDAPFGAPRPPGTINIVAVLPVALGDAALVNLATTATEAKAQAMFDAGLAGTGTVTDAVAIACPTIDAAGSVEPFGGPRSRLGAPLARAVHTSVLAGIRHSEAVIGRDRDAGARR